MATEFDPSDAVAADTFETQDTQPQVTAKIVTEDVPQHNMDPQYPDQGYGAVEPQEVVETPPEETIVEEIIEEKEVVVTEPEIEGEVIDIPLDEPTTPPVETQQPTELPEWVQKMVDFNKDTGGGLKEYQDYTKDFGSMNDKEVLREYYKRTKSNYSAEDIDYLIESKFGVGEYEEGEEISREDRMKQIEMKDELLTATQYLDDSKSKYYADLKSGVHGAPDQYKEAVDFYNTSKQSAEQAEVKRKDFQTRTKEVFNPDFKGFSFEADGKKYRLNAGDPAKVMDAQSDINNILGEFLDENGNFTDMTTYHKGMWAARNADKIFNAGLQQGKAAAITERAKATKNPDYDPNSGASLPPTKKPGIKFLGTDNNNQW